MDANLNPKRAYHELDRLINQEWKTTVILTTDACGKAAFRGFHGKYSAKVTAGGITRVFPFELKSGTLVNCATLQLK